MTWRVFLEKKPWSSVENLRIGRSRHDGFDLVQPFVFKTYPPDGVIPDDEIALVGSAFHPDGDVRGFLQAVMDLAWLEGIRPAGAEDQRNELKAVRDHLADMRALALSKS